MHVALSGGVVLRWKHILSAMWTAGSWSATIGHNCAAGYDDVPDLNGDPYKVPAFTTYGAQFSYTGVKNLKLTVCARNLFDKDPPVFIGAGSHYGMGFDPSQYDSHARFVYCPANYKFL